MKCAHFFLAAAAGLAAVFVLPANALAQKAAGAKPGRYADFHGIDEVTIVQPFQLRSYKRVVVQRPGDERAAAADVAGMLRAF